MPVATGYRRLLRLAGRGQLETCKEEKTAQRALDPAAESEIKLPHRLGRQQQRIAAMADEGIGKGTRNEQQNDRQGRIANPADGGNGK